MLRIARAVFWRAQSAEPRLNKMRTRLEEMARGLEKVLVRFGEKKDEPVAVFLEVWTQRDAACQCVCGTSRDAAHQRVCGT